MRGMQTHTAPSLPRLAPLALAMGLTRYATGRPCVRGHIAPRTAVDHTCVDCRKRDGYRADQRRRQQRRKGVQYVSACCPPRVPWSDPELLLNFFSTLRQLQELVPELEPTHEHWVPANAPQWVVDGVPQVIAEDVYHSKTGALLLRKGEACPMVCALAYERNYGVTTKRSNSSKGNRRWPLMDWTCADGSVMRPVWRPMGKPKWKRYPPPVVAGHVWLADGTRRTPTQAEVDASRLVWAGLPDVQEVTFRDVTSCTFRWNDAILELPQQQTRKELTMSKKTAQIAATLTAVVAAPAGSAAKVAATAKADRLVKKELAKAAQVAAPAPASKPAKAPRPVGNSEKMAAFAAKQAASPEGTATHALRAIFLSLPAGTSGTDAVIAAVEQGHNANSARKAYSIFRYGQQAAA